MAVIATIGYWNGGAPNFTTGGVSAETGTLKFGRDDLLASAAVVPIPTAAGTKYSWIKNLGINVTTTAPTTLSNRRVLVQTPQSDVQTLSATGATAGTFTLTFNGQTTASINWNDTAATIVTRLTALTTIGTGGVTATGGPLNTTPVVVTFANGTIALANMPQAAITFTGVLTTTPLTITHTTTGIQGLSGTTGLDLFFNPVASGSYAQAASGSSPADNGSTNDATPSPYTKITTSAQVYDAANGTGGTAGLNGKLCVMAMSVDFQYVNPPGQSLSAVTLPSILMLYDEV